MVLSFRSGAEAQEPTSPWAGKITTAYTGSFIAPGDPNRKSDLGAIAQVIYRLDTKTTFQGTFGFNQILEPGPQFTLTNPEFRSFTALVGGPNGWSWSIGPTAAAPVSQSAQNASLLFAVGLATRVQYHLAQRGRSGFLIYYDLGFNRNLHEYQTSMSGSVNTMSSIDHYLYAEYAFVGPWLLDIWLGFSSAWSYFNSVTNNDSFGQEVQYELRSNLDLSLAQETGGDFLSPSGQSYNFGLFDAQNARFIFSVIYRF